MLAVSAVVIKSNNESIQYFKRSVIYCNIENYIIETRVVGLTFASVLHSSRTNSSAMSGVIFLTIATRTYKEELS